MFRNVSYGRKLDEKVNKMALLAVKLIDYATYDRLTFV